MGTVDVDIHIAIPILNVESSYDSAGRHKGWSVSSIFESYSVENDAEVSWTAFDLPRSEGWCSYAHGTLFVRSNYHAHLFEPRKETRNDVTHVGKDIYQYLNGFHLGRLHHSSRGIYHMVFPTGFCLEKVDYLSDPLNIIAIYPNLVQRRVIVTWLYQDDIQLRILFRDKRKEWEAKECQKEYTYKIVTKQLEKNKKILAITDNKNVGSLLDLLPKILKIFDF